MAKKKDKKKGRFRKLFKVGAGVGGTIGLSYLGGIKAEARKTGIEHLKSLKSDEGRKAAVHRGRAIMKGIHEKLSKTRGRYKAYRLGKYLSKRSPTEVSSLHDKVTDFTNAPEKFGGVSWDSLRAARKKMDAGLPPFGAQKTVRKFFNPEGKMIQGAKYLKKVKRLKKR